MDGNHANGKQGADKQEVPAPSGVPAPASSSPSSASHVPSVPTYGQPPDTAVFRRMGGSSGLGAPISLHLRTGLNLSTGRAFGASGPAEPPAQMLGMGYGAQPFAAHGQDPAGHGRQGHSHQRLQQHQQHGQQQGLQASRGGHQRGHATTQQSQGPSATTAAATSSSSSSSSSSTSSSSMAMQMSSSSSSSLTRAEPPVKKQVSPPPPPPPEPTEREAFFLRLVLRISARHDPDHLLANPLDPLLRASELSGKYPPSDLTTVRARITHSADKVTLAHVARDLASMVTAARNWGLDGNPGILDAVMRIAEGSLLECCACGRYLERQGTLSRWIGAATWPDALQVLARAVRRMGLDPDDLMNGEGGLTGQSLNGEDLAVYSSNNDGSGGNGKNEEKLAYWTLPAPDGGAPIVPGSVVNTPGAAVGKAGQPSAALYREATGIAGLAPRNYVVTLRAMREYLGGSRSAAGDAVNRKLDAAVFGEEVANALHGSSAAGAGAGSATVPSGWWTNPPPRHSRRRAAAAKDKEKEKAAAAAAAMDIDDNNDGDEDDDNTNNGDSNAAGGAGSDPADANTVAVHEGITFTREELDNLLTLAPQGLDIATIANAVSIAASTLNGVGSPSTNTNATTPEQSSSAASRSAVEATLDRNYELILELQLTRASLRELQVARATLAAAHGEADPRVVALDNDAAMLRAEMESATRSLTEGVESALLQLPGEDTIPADGVLDTLNKLTGGFGRIETETQMRHALLKH